MISTKTKVRVALAAALTTTMGAAALAGTAAKADPMQWSAFAGVGSDTIQDVTNAFSGFDNGVDYTPLHSSSASGYKQIISFDAISPVTGGLDCIATKQGGPSFDRPNGSTSGKAALSRELDGTGWGTSTCGGQTDVSGQFAFARSSSGPSSGDTGTVLTYIPFARDGVSFAYYQADTTDQADYPTVTSLTKAQIISLFKTTGPQVINGTTVIPCGIQGGSGTQKFFENTIAGTSGTGSLTTLCDGLFPSNGLSGRSEENNGTSLKARGDALKALASDPAGWPTGADRAHVEVVIGFSAASWIARNNGAAPMLGANLVGMGSISDDGSSNNLGSPVSGASAPYSPVSTFFNNATFGRNVYYILPSSIAQNTNANQYKDLKSLYVGASSAVCLDTTVIHTFGFLDNSNCGSVSTQGSAVAGNHN
jgi:hypothetical protein